MLDRINRTLFRFLPYLAIFDLTFAALAHRHRNAFSVAIDVAWAVIPLVQARRGLKRNYNGAIRILDWYYEQKDHVKEYRSIAEDAVAYGRAVQNELAQAKAEIDRLLTVRPTLHAIPPHDGDAAFVGADDAANDPALD